MRGFQNSTPLASYGSNGKAFAQQVENLKPFWAEDPGEGNTIH